MNISPIRSKWAGTLTDRERFNRQMHYQPVDRCFNMEFGYWEENYELWPMFVDNGITNEAEADLFFNFDRIEVISGNTWLYPSFDEVVVEERQTTKIIRNEDGLLAEVPKDGHDTIPHYISATVRTPEDWRKGKGRALPASNPGRKLDIDALKAQHPAKRDYPLGVDCGSMIGKVRDMLTFEGLAYAIYDYPEMVEDMVETSCQMVEDFLDQVLPHFDFDYASGWEDICYKGGPIVSVKFFKNVVMPRYKRIHHKLQAQASTCGTSTAMATCARSCRR